MSCPLDATLAWCCLRSLVCKPDLTTDYYVEALDYYMRCDLNTTNVGRFHG